MNLCLLTAHSAEYAPLAALTEPNKLEYAQRHGYDFRSYILSDAGMTPNYKRIEILLWLLETSDYEWIWLTGTDSLITNQRKSLAEIIRANRTFDLVICKDAAGLNNDSFLIRPTKRAITYLRRVLEVRPTYEAHRLKEQQAMTNFVDMVRVAYIPQRRLNSYDYGLLSHLGENYEQAKDANGNDGQWQSSDLLIHWPNMTLERRLELAGEYLEKVQR